MLITFVLTLFIFSLNEAISRYWFSQSQLAPTLVGLSELLIGVYSGLPIPVSQALIWGGGLSSVREGWRNYDRVKDNWKPIYLLGNFVAVFLIWRLSQNVKLSEAKDAVQGEYMTSCPNASTIDAIGGEYPLFVSFK
jgi:hypothetical protein